MEVTACPFTSARLRELHWVERKSLAQIAALAADATGAAASDSDAAAWLEAAGIDAWHGSAIAQRVATCTDVQRAPAPVAAGQIIRKCANCGLDWPLASFASASVVCRNCHAVQTPRRPRARCLGKLAVDGKYECWSCHNYYVPADMVRPDRPTLSPKICKACLAAKSRAYYEANRERLQERSREQKRRTRAGGKTT